MSYNLSDMFDSISGYEKTLADMGFVAAGVGARAWSHRYTHPNGDLVEVQGTGWMHLRGQVMHEGTNFKSLKKHLLQYLSREELVDLLTA